MSDYDDDESFGGGDDDDSFGESPVLKQTKPRAAPKAAAKTTVPKKKVEVVEKENSEGSSPVSKPSKISAAAAGKMAIEDQYQKLTQHEHVLKRPDTYIGSTTPEPQDMWVWNSLTNRMEMRSISFPPGLYKIFDEILVNAADNAQRSTDEQKMKALKVKIDKTTGTISVWNDGPGIPIEMHKEHKMLVPSMIFGELLAGGNFNDNIAKVVGGRNGFGAKLTNIYSTRFSIECVDSSRGKKFRQEWRRNMYDKGEPKVTSDARKSDYVEVEFTPDFKRFNIDGISEDLYALFCKRVYDIAGCNAGITVYLNGEKLPIKSFKQYVQLYPLDVQEDGKPFALVYETPHERWEVAATVSTSGVFQQVSFVNSILTAEGGSHVTHVMESICKALEEKLNTKSNKGAAISKAVIKQHTWIFIRCLIENPSFSSQTKEKLTSKVTEFGSKCKLPDEFFAKFAKGGIKEYVLRFANFKAQKSLKNKGGKKVDRLRGIEKLDDANLAGTKDGKHCTLIVTEGDSAKTLAVCGLAVVGRDYYGVFPLRGKLLNVRGARVQELLQNKEISNLVKILGLRYQHKYESLDSLRYGKLMIMADQDVDGSHIKGLILNFIDVHWPDLLKLGFVVEFITPIVKARKGKEVLSFYTLPEYETWKNSPDSRGWTIKYYKGLGTSERQEAKEYFSQLEKHRVAFKYRGEMDRQTLDLAFHRDKAEDRKKWITDADSKDFLNTKTGHVTVADFVNKEMVHFSVESVHRAIPHIMDGMKPSHRKVLFGAFKRNLVKPIKVAQLAGYVSEKAAYHHGEQALQDTIVGMAQNFVGSNNINLLYPEGQFGSRLLGGKDASAARYIFTKLAPITRKIFHPDDDALLKYLDDDGFPVEPEYYVPIIPMILVNGASGIGTGWSTDIPNYNPRDIVRNLRHLIRGEPMDPMHPWYLGFKGSIAAKDWTLKATRNQYEVRGVFELDGTELNISELPIQTWTQAYKDFIETNLVDAPTPKGCFIADYKEYHTDTNVDFQISLVEEKLGELNTKGFEKQLKLVGSLSVNNLTAFGPDGKIHKYESVLDIIKDFYDIRLQFYQKRKEHLTAVLTEEYEILDNKVRFIESVISDEVKVRGRTKKQVTDELERFGFKKFALSKKKKKTATVDDDQGEVDDEDDDSNKKEDASYDYLLRMAIWSLTKEKADQLRRQRDEKKAELDAILGTPIKTMWERDLEDFLTSYDEFEKEITGAISGNESTRGIKTKPRTKGGKKATTTTTTTAASKATATAAAPAKKEEPAKKKAPVVKKSADSSFLDTSNYGLDGDDDDDDILNESDLAVLDELDDAVAAKKPAPAAKPAAQKRTSDEFDDFDDDDEPSKKKKVAPAAKPKRAAPAPKKKAVLDLVDDDDDFEIHDDDDDDGAKKKVTKKKPAAPAAPAAKKREAVAEPPGRKARAATTKKKTYIESDDDDDDDDDELELDDDDDVFDDDDEDDE